MMKRAERPESATVSVRRAGDAAGADGAGDEGAESLA